MLKKRSSGILLHPTSLPGKYGIGTLGKSAFEFIDFLGRAGQKYWQILPLGPTGYADSPYQCFSAHAGNPNLIDLETLVEEGLLRNSDLASYPRFHDRRVEFDAVQSARLPLLRKAWKTFTGDSENPGKHAYRTFQKDHASWLNDYALFRALKEEAGQKPWYLWDKPLKMKDPEAIKAAQSRLFEETDFHRFLQFLFFRQWMSVKEYAHERGIRIIGDIPLYVAMDSADAWSETGFFEFDEEKNPVRVGGVPPDYFSETGQLWGNPLFRWDRMKEDGYGWWFRRIRTNLFLYDIIRIDHFRGFAAYWAVPFAEKTAIRGEWVTCPGQDFFEALQQEFGSLPIIAEDLGVITPDVEALRDGVGLPGMKILQFAFDSSEANDYIPHNFPRNCVVYTGTHDNDTVRGWFESASQKDRNYVLDYTGSNGKEIHWDMIRLAWASVAYTAIVPMQDLLGLGNDARMNLPGTTQNNWQWRATREDFTPELAARLNALTRLFGRTASEKTVSQPD